MKTVNINMYNMNISSIIVYMTYSRTSNGSNTDGPFTMAVSKSFLSPLEKNPIAADLGQFRVIFYFL